MDQEEVLSRLQNAREICDREGLLLAVEALDKVIAEHRSLLGLTVVPEGFPVPEMMHGNDSFTMKRQEDAGNRRYKATQCSIQTRLS